MCAKVTQKYETKKERVKIPQKFCYLVFSVYLCPQQRAIKQAGGSESGVH